MWKALLLVGAGGFLGSICRYSISRLLMVRIPAPFPSGTFTVNIVGCLLMGVLLGWAEKEKIGENWRLLLATGFCGSFTTFSTFAYDGWSLAKNEMNLMAALYLAGSIVIGYLALAAGIYLSRHLL